MIRTLTMRRRNLCFEKVFARFWKRMTTTIKPQNRIKRTKRKQRQHHHQSTKRQNLHHLHLSVTTTMFAPMMIFCSTCCSNIKIKMKPMVDTAILSLVRAAQWPHLMPVEFITTATATKTQHQSHANNVFFAANMSILTTERNGNFNRIKKHA